MSQPDVKSLTERVWAYADETGQDADTVRVRLLTVISLVSPEVVDAAFAELRATGIR